jgi:hypothetical protein
MMDMLVLLLAATNLIKLLAELKIRVGGALL